jgi:hypothetical protein
MDPTDVLVVTPTHLRSVLEYYFHEARVRLGFRDPRRLVKRIPSETSRVWLFLGREKGRGDFIALQEMLYPVNKYKFGSLIIAECQVSASLQTEAESSGDERMKPERE